MKCKLSVDDIFNVATLASDGSHELGAVVNKHFLNVQVDESYTGSKEFHFVNVKLSGPVSFDAHGRLASRTSDGSNVSYYINIHTPENITIVCARTETLSGLKLDLFKTP